MRKNITLIVILYGFIGVADANPFSERDKFKSYIDQHESKTPYVFKCYQHPNFLNLQNLAQIYKATNIYRIVMASSWGHKVVQVRVLESGEIVVDYCRFDRMNANSKLSDAIVFNQVDSYTFLYKKGETFEMLKNTVYERDKWLKLLATKKGEIFAIDAASLVIESFSQSNYNAVIADSSILVNSEKKADQLQAVRVFSLISEKVKALRR